LNLGSQTDEIMWLIFTYPRIFVIASVFTRRSQNVFQLHVQKWARFENAHKIFRGSLLVNITMVARAQWALQSHKIVETLFRLGRKHVYHFAENLFSKRCTKFCQHCPRFMSDIT